MGKKLRGVKSVQDFFTEGDQNAGVDFLQYLNTYGDKSTSKTKLFKITKLNRAAKGASKEELDFIENEIQKEQEFEKVLQEQEEQIKLQDRISKLTPENQAIYSEWKKKGIDKLNEIEKFQNVEKVKNNPTNWRDRVEKDSEENTYWNQKGKGFGESVVQTIMEGGNDILDFVVNADKMFTGNSFYQKNKRESDRLYNSLQKPLVEERQKELREKAKPYLEKHNAISKQWDTSIDDSLWGKKDSNIDSYSRPWITGDNDTGYEDILDSYQDEINRLEDIKNSKGFWSGLYQGGKAPLIGDIKSTGRDVRTLFV